MSIDFDDPELEDRLTRRGDLLRRDLKSPDLHGMIAVATEARRHRQRWAWPLVAAVLLLSIPLITVLALHRSSSSHSIARPGVSDTSALPLLGKVPWNDAVLQPDGRTVVVLADVNHTPGNFCLSEGLPILRPVITETAAVVHIEVRAFGPQPTVGPSVAPGVSTGCFGVGRPPVPVTITLRAPLHGRPVTGGSTTNVQDAAGFLTPSYLPTGYTGSAVVVGGLGLAGNDLPHRIYSNGQKGELSVIRGAFHYSDPKIVATGTVRGWPARVMQEGSANDNVCASWQEKATIWSVCSLEGSEPALSPTELLKVANSLH